MLILRPEPGGSATAARARARGLTPVLTPLFEMRAVPWEAPEPGRHDAILFTSAHAPRLAGEGLARLLALPAYAVGEASAAAARSAGFADVRAGPADGAALLDLAASEGVRHALHLCGRDHIPLRHRAIGVERRIVYAAEPVDTPLEVPPGAVVLLHSPRAAARFAGRVPDRSGIRVAAISAAAAEAAGHGWAAKAVAHHPSDEALLEVASALCQNGRPNAAGAGT